MALKTTRQLVYTAFALLYLSTIQIYAQGGNKSPAQNSPLNALDSVRVIAKNARPGAPSLFEITFVLRDTLPSDAAFELTFPPELGLAQLEVAGSTTIDGGIKLTKDRQKVVLQRSGLGKDILPGQKVNLKLAFIRNPVNLAGNYVIALVIRSKGKAKDSMESKPRVRFQLR